MKGGGVYGYGGSFSKFEQLHCEIFRYLHMLKAGFHKREGTERSKEKKRVFVCMCEREREREVGGGRTESNT